MTETRRNILVTCALPYANGSIHLGHMVEHVQGDIWVRALRMRGHQVHFVCAEDAHGTPIMVNAERQGITAEELVDRVRSEHVADLADFAIGYDNYHSTHSEENRELVLGIFERLRDKDLIEVRTIEQYYDEDKGMFLPDRFIKGRCPNCNAADQYGDACESCGKTYSPTDLQAPYSVLTGKTPVLRSSDHYFMRLSAMEPFLREWVDRERLQPEVVNKLDEWFGQGLNDWDISRDSPYFGFAIPGESDKFFYVWVDAPVGYMASFLDYCRREGLDFDAWWGEDSGAELYHFIGKDITYFHTLFWPAMLHGAGYRLPTSVYVHGFLTVEGQKMSKSRGTFILARTYLDHLEPDYVRYYFASKLGSGLGDIDLSLDDFVARVNSDLVGKVVNIASRCAGFIQKHFDGHLAPALADEALYRRFAGEAEAVAVELEAREFNRAVRRIMALADDANRYIDERKPWKLIKEEESKAEVHAICTQGINLFRTLMVYLKPILPHTAVRAEAFLCCDPLDWEAAGQPLLDHAIAPFKRLMSRIDEAQVQAIVDASRGDLEATGASGPLADDPISEQIDFEAFSQVDLRVVRIVEADYVDGADKLLRLSLDLGGEKKQVFAGIKSAYRPEELVGRLTVMVANLAPRKMRFGVSEGMVLAASGGDGPFLLSADDGAAAGMRVK